VALPFEHPFQKSEIKCSLTQGNMRLNDKLFFQLGNPVRDHFGKICQGRDVKLSNVDCTSERQGAINKTGDGGARKDSVIDGVLSTRCSFLEACLRFRYGILRTRVPSNSRPRLRRPRRPNTVFVGKLELRRHIETKNKLTFPLPR